MNRITARMQDLAAKGETAFIPYITAGDPTLEKSGEILLELERAGADVIEYGIPFSDPVADGVVIQEASQRALKNDVNLHMVVAQVKALRQKTEIPILLFTYFNPVLAYGIETFAKDCADAGADGVLCVDLPPEEAEDYKQIMSDAGIATVFLASPTTRPERMGLIARFSEGFVYYVSRAGVTGVQDAVEGTVKGMVEEVKRHSAIPVAVGFGIAKPEQAEEVARYADGVVVGSAIVDCVGQHGASDDLVEQVGAFVRPLVEATKRAKAPAAS
jgi:tryptophan synthase alpha chain